MKRIKVSKRTAIISSSKTPTMLSVEGDACRLYMGDIPDNATAGHLVTGGYQIIIPAGINVFATAIAGDTDIVIGPFGV